MYDNGGGGAVDDLTAAKYYALAGDQGHAGTTLQL